MHRNFAGRAGRWSAAHWKTATFGWVALVLAAVALGMAAGTRKLTDAENSQGETARAERILADAGFDKSAEEAVLVQRRNGSASAGAVAAEVSQMLRARHDVENVKLPSAPRTGAPCSCSST
jgi:RND superfamily putative drug exporter